MNHKRRRPKDARAGCLLYKPHKSNSVGERAATPGAALRTLQEPVEDVVEGFALPWGGFGWGENDYELHELSDARDADERGCWVCGTDECGKPNDPAHHGHASPPLSRKLAA